ncbi:MAG: 30S ribosomal protein S21 [Mycoplasmoidaceae bacterium]|nr:30S ribosomal protein S21 [Mycoplasmoidaceae bacterium]
MQKVIVKDGDLNDAMKKFSRISAETRRAAQAHTYYLRPGLKRMEKSKQAQRRKFK